MLSIVPERLLKRGDRVVGILIVDVYLRARFLLREASDILEKAGETLIVAHIATPLALLDDRVSLPGGSPGRDLPG